jgi:hypothetical protein
MFAGFLKTGFSINVSSGQLLFQLRIDTDKK